MAFSDNLYHNDLRQAQESLNHCGRESLCLITTNVS
jgi:hypothetical protein